MPGRTRYPVFILSFIFFILLQDKPAFAQYQPYLDKKISFTFTDSPISNVLKAIGNKTGVKFSYSPDLFQSGRRITMRFNNLPLREVLKELLNDPTISFREIGNQIVLYRGDPSLIPLEPNQRIVTGKPQIVIPAKKIPDTVYVYRLDTLIINNTDTVFRRITLTRYDTIRITDTVFIEKPRPTQKAGKSVKNNFNENSVTHKKFLENNGFYSGVYFEFLPGSATYKSTSSGTEEYVSMMKNAVSDQSFKFSTGIVAGYDYHAIGIRSGIGYTKLGEKFGYAFNIETGGFFKTDTVETYYTLTGIDTSWFYITDSTWIPKDSKNYSYQNPNSYSYLEVPLSLKIRFWQNESAEIYALGGVTASFLVSVDAMHINPANNNEVIMTGKDDLKPFLLSWNAGIGAAFKLTTRTGIITEASYRKQTSSQYKDLPVDKRYGLFGLKLAAYMKF